MRIEVQPLNFFCYLLFILLQSVHYVQRIGRLAQTFVFRINKAAFKWHDRTSLQRPQMRDAESME